MSYSTIMSIWSNNRPTLDRPILDTSRAAVWHWEISVFTMTRHTKIDQEFTQCTRTTTSNPLQSTGQTHALK